MNNCLSLLGIARLASKIVLGDNNLHKLKSLKLLIVCNDASENTKQRYKNRCLINKVPYYVAFTSEELSKAIGCHGVKVIGLTDSGLAKALINKMKEEEDG